MRIRVGLRNLFVLLLAAGLGAWPAVSAAQTIKVGAVVPLTGRYGAGGAQARAGYEIGVADVNRAGGVSVGGKKTPLELVLLDDESDATKTVSRFESLAAQGVVAYLGTFGSDLHAAAASVAEKNKIPYLGVAFALHKIHQQGFRYLFSPFWKSPDIGRELVPMLTGGWRSSRRRRTGGARWPPPGSRPGRPPATRSSRRGSTRRGPRTTPT